MAKDDKMEKIVSLCKRRGFVYPSSEIYGGFSAIYDLGPYGVELAKNIKETWWKKMVQENQEIVGLDSAVFMSPKIWEASGHVTGFADPLSECKSCHSRSRVDHLLEDIDVFADEKMTEEEINKLFSEHKDKIKCSKCGDSKWTDVVKFNLLVQSNLGNFTGDWAKEPVYLRGETCQGIYVNYKNVMDSARVKIPFGIAQIGKAFRNEIVASNFIFRLREFEQMEIEYLIHPDFKWEESFENWLKQQEDFARELGAKDEDIRRFEHSQEKLSHYSKKTIDIEYNFPFGFKELFGLAHRGDFDLTQHTKFGNEKLEYFDQEKDERYTPNIIEPTFGVERSLLVSLCAAYTEEKVGEDTRVVMKFPKKLAPIKVAFLPLSKKEELSIPTKELFKSLSDKFMCQYDETQSIGKRYRRQDEIGTPYCVTYDFESLEDKAVTVRDRDTMQQERIKIEELENYLTEKLSN